MAEQIKSANIKIILILTLVHFLGDFFSSFATPLIPTFVEKFSLTMAQVGLITGIIRFLAFIIQPSVGYFADRYQTRSFILGGLFLTIFFIPLSGIAPTYFLLTLVLAIGATGSSMLHPSVTGMIPSYGGRNTGFSMSVFNTGGTLAFGVGPIFIAWFVHKYGLSAMPATMIIGMTAMIFLYRVVPVPISEGLRYSGFIGSMKETLGKVWKPILLIWSVMVLRSVVGQSFLTFTPVLLSTKGYSLISIGSIISIFIVAGTASGLITGFLSDRIDFKKIFFVAYALMTPSLLLFLYVKGNWVYSGAFLAGLFVFATLPLGVVMAQELAPKGRSMVASLMMGLAYGLGGALSPLIGKLADIFSIQTMLFNIAFIPLLTLGLIFFFPKIRGKKQ